MSRILYRYLVVKFLLLALLLMQAPSALQAQEAGGGGGGGEDLFANSMQDMMIVTGAGVGGAILGLSTLSFVEEPMDHMKNILVGGALGIIIGVAIVAVNQADMSRDSYLKNAGYRSDPASLRPLQQDRREGRLRRALAQKGQLISTPLFFNYSLTF